MDIVAIVRVVAIVGAGLLAGIFLGHRAGAQSALRKLSDSSFVQFQQGVHKHFVRFMPPLALITLLTAAAWLVMLWRQRGSVEFWLVAASTCGIVLIAALTRAVNAPLNNMLMTWDAAAPPENLRALWAPWDRVNTIRAIVATVVLVMEAVALSVRAV